MLLASIGSPWCSITRNSINSISRATQYSPDGQKFFKPVCVSDKLRSTTWCRCRGITLSKKTETECNLYFTDGKIARFRFEATESDEPESYLLYGNHVTESKFVARVFGPSDLIDSDFEKFEKVKFKLRQIAQVRLEWVEYVIIVYFSLEKLLMLRL